MLPRVIEILTALSPLLLGTCALSSHVAAFHNIDPPLHALGGLANLTRRRFADGEE